MKPEEFARAMRAARMKVEKLSVPTLADAVTHGYLESRGRGAYRFTEAGAAALSVEVKRGRPRVEEPRSQCFNVFVTRRIQIWIKEEAARARMSESAWVSMRLTELRENDEIVLKLAESVAAALAAKRRNFG